MREIGILAGKLRVFLDPALWLLLLSAAIAACAAARSEGLDVAELPLEVRSDYELFAVRCSKCHSLARPLESGIKDDVFWAKYVERMRRQPGSGISPADEIPILRFLHYYSLDKKAPETAPDKKAPAASPDKKAPGASPDKKAPEASPDKKAPETSPVEKAPEGPAEEKR